jgi:hypothetical protein
VSTITGVSLALGVAGMFVRMVTGMMLYFLMVDSHAIMMLVMHSINTMVSSVACSNMGHPVCCARYMINVPSADPRMADTRMKTGNHDDMMDVLF